MEFYKNQKKLHRKFAYKVCNLLSIFSEIISKCLRTIKRSTKNLTSIGYDIVVAIHNVFIWKMKCIIDR